MTEEKLFHDALAKSPAERAFFLDEACAGQPELRAAVEALLAAHEQSGSFLDQPAAGDLGETVDSAAPEDQFGATAHTPEPDDATSVAATADYRPHAVPGLVIADRYVLQEEIGAGGMGEVWVAKQTEPVKRRVALKLIKAGMDSKAVLARFEQERQALAMMDHPNIARVLDGGMTGQSSRHAPRAVAADGTRSVPATLGQPFFVMELVNGLPLTKFCDDAKLGVRERLELFVPICQAVQHAHQKGIVHRDLKPANILITMVDGKPIPKVIDFGVAKATGGKLTDESMSTQFGAVVGTFEYMSPEQAGFSGVDVDTRADVYSLGVILYELLTGLRPIDAARLRNAALNEMIRIIQEEVPSKPSTRLSTAESSPSVAALRQTEPKKLSALLRGELDWVVMKCLEKQRDRRYETANALALDVQRYLADEPVEARPPSAGYRLRKLIRRHKGRVVAASLLLLALLAGIVGTSWGLVEAKRAQRAEHERAEGERLAKLDADRKRQEAEANLAYARKGNEILGSVFRDLDPKQDYATVGELRDALKENLTRAIKELKGTAIGDPLEVAAMQSTLGESLLGLGEARLAVAVLQEARDTRAARLAPDHPDRLASMNILGAAYREAGQLDKALPLLEKTLDLTKAKLGPNHPDTFASKSNLALAYQDAGQLDKALPLFEETLALRQAMPGPRHPDTLKSMNDLAECYKAVGELRKALPLFEKTLTLRKAILGPDHPDTVQSMNDLATGYQADGKLGKMLPLYERALKLTKARFGPEHPRTLTAMINLAMGRKAAGELDTVVPSLEEVLALAKSNLDREHTLTLNVMSNLGLAYRDARELDKALPLLKETVTRTKTKLGRDHPKTLITMNNLALGYAEAGRWDKALPLFEQTVEMQKAKLPPNHPDTLNSLANLAAGYGKTGRLEKAVPLTEEVLRIQKAKLGHDHPGTLSSMSSLAVMYWSLKRLDRSVPMFEELCSLLEKKLGRNHPETIRARANLGVNYKDVGKLKEAIPLLEEASRAAKKYPALRGFAAQLLDGYAKAGENDKLVKLIREELSAVRAALPKGSPQLAGRLAALSLPLLRAKAFAEAEPLIRECLAIREKHLPDLWLTSNTQSMLGGALLGQKKLAEAEPLLLKGYEGMKKREETIPPPGKIRQVEAMERLVQLYEKTGKKDDAAKWRKELMAMKAAQKERENQR